MSLPRPARRVIEIKPVIDPDAKVYPRSIQGVFQRWRWGFVWLTQLVFYGLCWLPWNGRQAILFDLEARRAYLFDLVLWPQDAIYLALLLILCALALFLFTTVAGRLWCGYSCPQTVYTELFLWIEKLVEGDRPRRMKFDAAAWSPRKLRIKATKHALWLLVGLWTGISFVGYFTPIRELTQDLATLSLGPWESFWVLFYGFATYGNAGFLREQMCIYICPYAQFQFVMFDRDTLLIAYDKERGEPRGSRAKEVDAKAAGLGDCIDCSICVQVCPTGIDIRNGLQLECIGCAACIDACDQVMDKMNYPRGLIRYATENAVQERLPRRDIIRRALRPRVLTYLLIFVTATSATAWSLLTRPPLKVDIIRDRTTLSREAADGSIENVFRLRVINASEQAHSYTVRADGLPTLSFAQPAQISVGPAATGDATLILRVDPGAVRMGTHQIRLTVTDAADPGVSRTEATKFFVP
ncbi:cytochrome c oxidase accessory protein CcoG [Sulfuritalea sp.]|uniref:cytochrome c oxidase accessory protein CcoG n=1 Tax=Sulfuritalea sp. TaxID=2480090 RepID=UPI00286DC2E5|nr:cytochrome c oxidase accessory protein CcoG [Sulfuritalea sp.]